MDQLLMTLLSWQFLLFCLGLAAVTEVIRRFVEYFEKDVKDLKLWHDLILPISPVFLGALFAGFISMYPYPEGITSAGARVIFGLVSGLLSGFIYRALKAFIKAFIRDKGVNLPEAGPSDYTIDSVRETIRRDPIVPDVENKTDSE
jgi:hypothetical protein